MQLAQANQNQLIDRQCGDGLSSDADFSFIDVSFKCANVHDVKVAMKTTWRFARRTMRRRSKHCRDRDYSRRVISLRNA
jgi:hypothetical protein